MAKTVLLVDDEIDMAKLTALRLQHAGYDVLTAPGCQVAFETLRNQKVDLILLDIHLTGLNGYEICKAIRENELTENLPVIFFSASSVTEVIRQKIKELNAQGFVQKPFDTRELLAKIREILTRRSKA